MKDKLDEYEEFFELKSNVETGLLMIETILLNGKNEKANRYIEMAIPELRRALSYMSDAEFELHTWGPDGFEG